MSKKNIRILAVCIICVVWAAVICVAVASVRKRLANNNVPGAAEKTTTENEITEKVATEKTTTELAEQATETSTETTGEITTEVTTEEEIDLNEESHKAYQEFLDGERTAIVMDNGEFYDGEYASILQSGEEISLEIMDARFTADYDQGKRYYGYGDFVCDGTDELAIDYRPDDESYEENFIYLKYMDGQLYIFENVSKSMYGGAWINSVGKMYNVTDVVEIENIFDSECQSHEIYWSGAYWYAEKNEQLDAVMSAMSNEFGIYLDGDLLTYRIGGELYYTLQGKEEFLDDTQRARYNELIDEYNVKIYSPQELQKLIKAEEEKYVPDGITGDAPEIDWVEF